MEQIDFYLVAEDMCPPTMNMHLLYMLTWLDSSVIFTLWSIGIVNPPRVKKIREKINMIVDT